MNNANGVTEMIVRKGIQCYEITKEEFNFQLCGAEFIDSSEQFGYGEYHYATDEYDLYVFHRNDIPYRWFSNRDS